MEKIKELLRGIGGSEELVAALCEELDRYTANVHEGLQEELQSRLEKARKTCLAEVNQEKARLSKKVEIFLESKKESMEQAAARQRAIEEAEATSLLKRAKGLLEGIEIGDGGDSRKLQAAQTKIARLDKQLGALKEERASAIDKANNAFAIAQKVLAENRALESKTLKESDNPFAKENQDDSGEESGGSKKVCDDCGKPHKGPDALKCKCAKSESRRRRRVPKRRRLDEGRKRPGKVGSTRRTLVESQRQSGKASGSTTQPRSEIDSIAEQMPEE